MVMIYESFFDSAFYKREIIFHIVESLPKSIIRLYFSRIIFFHIITMAPSAVAQESTTPQAGYDPQTQVTLGGKVIAST